MKLLAGAPCTGPDAVKHPPGHNETRHLHRLDQAPGPPLPVGIPLPHHQPGGAVGLWLQDKCPGKIERARGGSGWHPQDEGVSRIH
jgi:hypothetical protein